MSIINEALKKTQTNLDNSKEKTITVADDRISLGQKTWQRPPTQPSPGFTPKPSSPVPLAGAAIPETTRVASQQKPASKRWYFIVLMEILVLGLAIWTLFIFQPQLFRSSFEPKISSPASKNITRTAQPHPAAPPPQSAPTTNVAPEIKYTLPKNNLVLNGIMMNQNKMVALINGEVYEVGNYIGTQRVNKITLEGVELRDGDEVTILNVRNQGR